MKKITKIFTTIVVAFAAYSCVADATEDLGVQLGSGEGLTSITLSLGEPDTKVQFGTKDGDTYPLYWNEGDVVSIQGDANFWQSTPLTGVAENEKEATFQFDFSTNPLIENKELHIVYPAHSEDYDTADSPRYTTHTFIIPAEQQYCEGSVDPKALVLYGVIPAGGDLSNIQMKSDVGVLRIAVNGKGEVLKDLTVETLNEEKIGAAGYDDNGIAGGFIYFSAGGNSNQKFRTGGRRGATRTITMVLPEEGLTLGEKDQVIYVAVRGVGSGVDGEANHGVMKVTLTDAEGNQMAVTFDTTQKPIKAGVVREFTPITFTPNVDNGGDEPVEGGELVINDEADLVMFAKNAANYTKATVTNNLDMNNVSAENLAYFPIDGFNGTEFDGGNFEISNLTTPLFDTTSANIKNVKLTNVNIIETTRAISGAIACQINGGSLENCSATGTMTVTPDSATLRQIGGLVGVAADETSITNCTNDVDITLTLVFETENNISIGGVASHISGTVDGAFNTGNINVGQTGTNNKKTYCDIGGVFGSSTSTRITNITNGELGADDKGKISVDANFNPSHGELQVAGLICLSTGIDASYTNCNNYGDILVGNTGTTLTSTINDAVLAGLSAYACQTATWDNCHNYGDITLERSSFIMKYAFIGGIYGYNGFANLKVGKVGNTNITTTSAQTFKGCSNSGNISIYGQLALNNASSMYPHYIGGLVAGVDSNATITIEDGFVNNGNITYAGTVGRANSTFTSLVGPVVGSVGGIIGCVNSTTFDMSGWDGTVANTGTITNNSSRTATTDAAIAMIDLHLGGVIGYSTSAINYPVTNTGGLVLSGTYYDNIYVGGIVGNTTSTVTGARCYCQINANAFSNVGWIMGSARSATVKATNCAIGGYTLVHDIENEIDKVVPAFTISNYYDYIYGGTTDWTGVTNYDGCGYLSSKDAEVQYPAATTE